MAVTAYGGGPGDVTHVVLTGRMIEAERWIMQKGLPRKSVLIVAKSEHLTGQLLRDSVTIQILPSFERLSSLRRAQLRAELRSRMKS